jgi:hypothetical protein
VAEGFWATGLSQLDGVAADGIHLLWSSHRNAPFSVRGFDIQRRVAAPHDKVGCYMLSPSELAQLNDSLRLVTPVAHFSLQETQCPMPPDKLPDTPFTGTVPTSRRRCVDFRTYAVGPQTNPLVVSNIHFQVRGVTAPSAGSRVAATPHGNGLDAGNELVVKLEKPVRWVSLLMVHLAPPATVEVLNRDGSIAGRGSMFGDGSEAESVEFTGPEINRITVRATKGASFLLQICTASTVPRASRGITTSVGSGMTASSASAAVAAPIRSVSSLVAAAPAEYAAARHAFHLSRQRCYAYDLDLKEARRDVRVAVGVPFLLAVALREGKVVHFRYAADSTGLQVVTFGPRPVDRVKLYVGSHAKSLELCFTIALTREKEEAAWAGTPYIAKGIQMPLRTVDASLLSATNEATRAAGRLLTGEVFDATAFGQLASMLNDAVLTTRGEALYASHFTRENEDAPLVDLRPWPFGLSLMLLTAWRRMLGFGFLDPGTGLVVGQRYEYRITGYFRRRDVDETFRGFHTVPVGTMLPPSFHLGNVLFQTSSSLRVTLAAPTATTTLRATSRKGVALGGSSPSRLVIELEFPTLALSIELEPRPGDHLTWKATSPDSIPGLTGSTESGVLTIATRVDLQFTVPMQTVVLTGKAFLYGVRVLGGVPPAGSSPDDLVPISVVTEPIQYEKTPLPAPPPWIGTVHLQEPILPGDPAVTTRRAPQDLGFRVFWLPPPSTGCPVPTWWPADLAAYPPTDVVGYQLERRQVDGTGTYSRVGDGDLLFYGSRGSRQDPPPLGRGIDLLSVYPERPAPVPPVPIYVDAEDVLLAPDGSGPAPGSVHQYRVSSVDVLGRVSPPTTGSVVRLEKRRPPPQPVGPTAPASGYGPAAPAGIRARVIQSGVPGLSVTDLAILGTSRNAIVLEWGWRDHEAQLDPFATEFRIYLQTKPPDLVSGQLIGVASVQGTGFRMNATLDLPVTANEMVGHYFDAGGYPFRVAAHSAGTGITIDFLASALEPSSVPQAATFVFMRQPTGESLRPSAMERRVAVLAVAGTGAHQYVFADLLTLDATHPNARVWVGVSAADDQSYVPDEIPASALNGGRPGNESRVAVAVASARYVGQPAFTVPLPLPNVPEVVINEPATNDVPCPLDLPALLPGVPLPAGANVRLERLPMDTLLARVSANADNTVGVELPIGTAVSYTLANQIDHSTFVAQIRSGAPGRIENKFIMDLLTRYNVQLETLWSPTKIDAAPMGLVVDALPGKAERYLHRVRAVDAAGHVSTGAAVLPQVVRVPSLRSPASPRLEIPDSANDIVNVTITYKDGFDLRWLVVFTLSGDAQTRLDDAVLISPQLLRQPNLRTRYPNDGIRVRLANGTNLSPAAVVTLTPGSTEGQERSANASLTIGFGKRIAVWGMTMTRDGIPSPLAGPKMALTAPTPPVPSSLAIASLPPVDRATWTAPGSSLEVRLERSVDGGTTWGEVTAWLPGTTATIDVTAAGGAGRQYRFVLRDSLHRLFPSAVVTPT